MEFSYRFIVKLIDTAKIIDTGEISKIIDEIIKVKALNGRLFVLGVGGSAANASHAVNDFRKLTNIKTYCPTDNVAEVTAKTNDEGWDTAFEEWLRVNKLTNDDAILILSVGGGDKEKNGSVNLIKAAEYAKKMDCKVLCIVGRRGGEVGKIADAKIQIPMLYEDLVTPITESLQSVVLHLIVSHPALAENKTKW